MVKFIFYTDYILLFVLGGFLTLFGLIPFRPFYASFLVLFLVPVFGIRLDRVTRLFILFTLIIVISGIINGSSLSQIFMFLRFVIIPYAMYYLVRVFINHKNVKKIIRLSIAIGMIQLPVVVIQRLFHEQIIRHATVFIGPVDFYFGTFYLRDDSALSLFLMGLVIFLLFDRGNNYFIRHKLLKAAWLTITVLLANSIISHMLVAGIWAYFFLKAFSLKTILNVSVAGIIIIGFATYSGYRNTWQELVVPAIDQVTFQRIEGESRFLEGNYARTAAVIYYLNQPIKIFGDGPSRYYNPSTREYVIGNMGQIFGFYAEIGLVGLAMGYLIILAMTWERRRTSRLVALPLFAVMTVMTITNSVMSDASIMLAYNIFLSTNLMRANVRNFQTRPLKG